jgi:Spondin_N
MTRLLSRAAITVAALLISASSIAQEAQSAAADARAGKHVRTYEVTITNITRGQTFTPILVATHSPRVAFFELGAPASAGLAFLAEDGNPSQLAAALAATGEVFDAQTIPGLLAPGASATVTVTARGRFDQVSLAAMLIPTNDAFVALNGLNLPSHGGAVRTLVAYDAGSEPNDELCASIPGPRCGGQGASPGGGEGYVHVSVGMHGIGDLGPAIYDWRNPVARVEIRRVD